MKCIQRLFLIVALPFFFMLIPWALSRTFPPVNVDEAFLSNHAYNWMTHHNNRYSLYDDLFEPTLYQWRDATAGLLQIVYESWIGPFVTWMPKSLSDARLSSFAAGFVTLLLLFLIGRGIQGSTLGVALVTLAAVHPFFLLASTLVRAEMVLLMFMTGLLGLALWLPESAAWKYLALGVLSGLGIGIHQNSVPAFMGLFTFCICRHSSQERVKRIIFLILGFLLGIALVMKMIDVPKFWFSQKYGFYELYKPPILSWPWHPLVWIKQWVSLSFTGRPSWYLQENHFASWTFSLLFYWIGIGLFFCAFMVRRLAVGKSEPAPSLFLPLLAAQAGIFIGMCFWIRKQEALYTSIFIPYLAMLAGLAWQDLGRHKRKIAVCGLLVLALSLFSFLKFTRDYQTTYLPYAEMRQQIHRLIPPNAKVAAPAFLWFDWPDDQFRDISALVGSRWITGGRRDVRLWLSGWKPDVIVIEGSWKRMLLGKGDTLSLLRTVLALPVTYLGSVDTGAACAGVLELYRLDWTH